MKDPTMLLPTTTVVDKRLKKLGQSTWPLLALLILGVVIFSTMNVLYWGRHESEERHLQIPVIIKNSVIHFYGNGQPASSKIEGVCKEKVDKLELQMSQLNSTILKIISGAQRTGLDTLNNSAIKNRANTRIIPEVNICEAQKPAFIASATKSVSLDCGGTIQLPSPGESILLDFNLGSSQRCLWTMDATQNKKLFYFNVKLTLLCKHPKPILDDNTLAFTEWHADGPNNEQIATNRISSHNSILLSHDDVIRGFLSFNAKRNHSEAGFFLRVDVLRTGDSSSTSSLSTTHRESVGSASYTLPSSYDVSSIVINPQTVAKMTLTVDVDSNGIRNPCQTDDSVDLLEFGMDGVPKQLGRLCGHQSAISYKTENPVAALFAWEGGKSGGGVKLSWKTFIR